jgi:hypothetical protein
MDEKVNLEILFEVVIPENIERRILNLIREIEPKKKPSSVSTEDGKKWTFQGIDPEKLSEELIEQIENLEVTVFVMKIKKRCKIANLLNNLKNFCILK